MAKKVTYNGLDISDICTDAFEKGGWADVILHVKAGKEWKPLMNVGNSKKPIPYTVRIHGPIKVTEE